MKVRQSSYNLVDWVGMPNEMNPIFMAKKGFKCIDSYCV